MTNSDDAWSSFHEERVRQSNFPRWPESSIVKVAFGNYLAKRLSLPNHAVVLDVGCGFGNNLLPYAEVGHRVAGVELSETIAETARKFLGSRGHDADIRVGHNRSLPFEDARFDLLLSVNALHYEGTRENVRLALAEFERVLRPGGRMLLMTVAPGHEIRRTCVDLGDGRYRVVGYDFRDGEIMFYFNTEAELAGMVGERLGDVETGRVTESLMTRTLDFFVASGTRVA